MHAPETVRHYGPGLARYWSYRLFDVPAEADRYHPNRGRMTEIWYRVEDLDEMNGVPPAYTPADRAPGWDMGGERKRHATVFMPASNAFGIHSSHILKYSSMERPEFLNW